jgi:hypothetical protein
MEKHGGASAPRLGSIVRGPASRTVGAVLSWTSIASRVLAQKLWAARSPPDASRSAQITTVCAADGNINGSGPLAFSAAIGHDDLGERGSRDAG